MGHFFYRKGRGGAGWLAPAKGGYSEPDATARAEMTAPRSYTIPGLAALPAQTVQGIIEASGSFGFRLLTALDEGKPERNVFFSPLSLASVLLMAANGAGGQTRAEMLAALGLDGFKLADINAVYAALLGLLRDPNEDMELSIANAIWIQNGLRFLPDFQYDCERFYAAQAEIFDSDLSTAVRQVNGWVNDHTLGKIPSIIEQINPMTVAILTNAIYFHGRWKAPFPPERTMPAPFYLESGETRDVSLMCLDEKLPYRESEGYQAVKLGYCGGRASLSIYLPKPGVSLRDMARRIGAGTESYAEPFESRKVTLYLPKFHVDFAATMVGTLKSLGVRQAFGSGADFGRMVAGHEVFISEVRHKATLDVDEEGTTAAAASLIGMTLCCMVFDEDGPVEMRVDRPFLCMIDDNSTGIPLFQGVIRSPDPAQ